MTMTNDFFEACKWSTRDTLDACQLVSREWAEEIEKSNILPLRALCEVLVVSRKLRGASLNDFDFLVNFE